MNLSLANATTKHARRGPTAPRTLEESGLSLELLSQLVMKTLYFAGELTGAEVARRLGVMFGVIEPSLEFIRSQRHCEILGGAMLGGAAYRYRITNEGRMTALLYLQQNQYVGVAPVPLKQYQDYLHALQEESTLPTAGEKTGRERVTRTQVVAAYKHLVLGDKVLDELGPAINAGRSIFIYGPPGNGKSVMARGLRNLLAGDIAVPHAIEIEGSIVRVFDPVTHEVAAHVQQDPDGLTWSEDLDRRWVICVRPIVWTGGELTLASMDLTYSSTLGYYRAPLQVAANGGVLVIDDFGRQRCSPQDLLNRWMVPLESGVDYLTLQSGLKFEVPFLAFVAFATNIRPSDLVDEAFLRRVQYKVFADDPSKEGYARIFEMECQERGLAFDARLVDRLLNDFYSVRMLPLRACQPRDLINHALLLAEYRGEPRQLSWDLLETACSNYFVEDR